MHIVGTGQQDLLLKLIDAHPSPCTRALRFYWDIYGMWIVGCSSKTLHLVTLNPKLQMRHFKKGAKLHIAIECRNKVLMFSTCIRFDTES